MLILAPDKAEGSELQEKRFSQCCIITERNEGAVVNSMVAHFLLDDGVDNTLRHH